MSTPEEQLQTLQVITDVLGWISFVCNTLIFIGYTYVMYIIELIKYYGPNQLTSGA